MAFIAFVAKFKGICVAGNHGFRKGKLITRWGERWACAECAKKQQKPRSIRSVANQLSLF